MLAYYVEWHLKQCLAPLLFEDEEIDDGSLNVIKASRSESAQSKERKKRLFGLCYAMDWVYRGCNPYVERHLAIFVNCF